MILKELRISRHLSQELVSSNVWVKCQDNPTD